MRVLRVSQNETTVKMQSLAHVSERETILRRCQQTIKITVQQLLGEINNTKVNINQNMSVLAYPTRG